MLLPTIYGAWSGIKTAAFVFHQLYAKRKLVKTDVDSCPVKSRGHDGAGCKILDVVGRMVGLMADEETIPVSKDVNKCLTELAGMIHGEISNLNKDKVSNAVEKRIHMILEQDSM